MRPHPWHPGRRPTMAGHRRLRGYIGARLHRRLFVGLGLSVLLAFAAAALALYLLRPEEASKPDLGRIEALFAHQFGEAWLDPARRADLAERTSTAFAVPLTLRDRVGTPVGTFGGGCPEPLRQIAVHGADGSALGAVDVCRPRGWKSGRNAFLGAIAAAAAGLWLFAGLWAHHIGRPLWALVQVTREIGTGQLERRVRLNRYRGGEVGELAASIDDMAARIEKQLRDQRELLAAVSHEIRTPLTRLRVLSEMMRDRGADGRLVDDVEREISEIDDLTGQLLASSRLDFEAVERTPLDVVEVCRVALQRQGLPRDLLVAEDTASIRGDATLLGRALANLLSNARVHGAGVHRVSVQSAKERVEVVVEDTGPGFRAGELDRAFEAFRRGQGSGKSAGALGLGLSLVRRIARAHGGDAFVDNRDEGGARVGFWIPR